MSKLYIQISYHCKNINKTVIFSFQNLGINTKYQLIIQMKQTTESKTMQKKIQLSLIKYQRPKQTFFLKCLTHCKNKLLAITHTLKQQCLNFGYLLLWIKEPLLTWLAQFCSQQRKTRTGKQQIIKMEKGPRT